MCTFQDLYKEKFKISSEITAKFLTIKEKKRALFPFMFTVTLKDISISF